MSKSKKTKNQSENNEMMTENNEKLTAETALSEIEEQTLTDELIEYSEEEAAEGFVEFQLEEEAATFLPEVSEEDLGAVENQSASEIAVDVSGTELDSYESAEIEEEEFIEEERLESIIESVLFASDRPVSLASLKMVFKGTSIKGDKIKRALDRLAVEYAGSRRGVTLEEVTGGYQLRTKIDNLEFLRGNIKAKIFKLSGPALEVLSIVAYKQPIVKSEVDEIRGVESGHLMRALMEKGLVNFEGKSDLPGRPMQYGTTRKFLEIFGLRNLKELPTLSQIDELLPEGIGEEEVSEKPKLSDITDSMSEQIVSSYSQGEEELVKIQSQLEEISTSSDFFEQEKIKQRQKKDQEKAQNIREALAVGEEVATRDLNWLKRYDEALAAGTQFVSTGEEVSTGGSIEATSRAEASESADLSSEVDVVEGLFEEEAPHIEDELPFVAEADEIDEVDTDADNHGQGSSETHL